VQSGVLIHLLTALADLLGTPATELLWIQVRACVCMRMCIFVSMPAHMWGYAHVASRLDPGWCK